MSCVGPRQIGTGTHNNLRVGSLFLPPELGSRVPYWEHGLLLWDCHCIKTLPLWDHHYSGEWMGNQGSKNATNLSCHFISLLFAWLMQAFDYFPDFWQHWFWLFWHWHFVVHRESWNLSPMDTKGQLSLEGVKSFMWIFICVLGGGGGVSALKPMFVKGQLYLLIHYFCMNFWE